MHLAARTARPIAICPGIINLGAFLQVATCTTSLDKRSDFAQQFQGANMLEPITSLKPADSSNGDLPEENEAANERGNWSVVCLDGLAVLAEHAKAIVIVTLLAGVLAYGVASLLPRIYTSVAYVGPLEDSSAKGPDVAAKGADLVGKGAEMVMRGADVVVLSAPVLDAVLAKFPQYRSGDSLEERRDHLSSRLVWKIVKGSPQKSALYTVKLDDTDPRRAQSMLSAILDTWLETIGPRPDTSARLAKTLEASEAQAADLSQVITELKKRPEAMFADARNNYFPPNIVDMIKLRTDTAARIVDLMLALRAGSRDLIFSPPTLPEQPSGPDKRAIVSTSMAFALFGVIAFFLLSWRLSLAARKPAYAPMFDRIRRARPW
jgi:hypothetical protein